MKKNTQRNFGAFTLIEVMLAISILMFIVFAIYAAWSSVLRSSKTGLDAAATAQRSRIAMRAVEDALLTSQVFAANMPYYWFVADTSGQFPSLSVVSRLPANFPGSGVFGDQVVRRVTFSVEPGTNNHQQLVMTQMPVMLATNSDIQPYPIVLAPNVKDFVLEFWSTNEWVADWDYTNKLPQMVRISLQLGEDSPRGVPPPVSSRVVALPSVIVTRDYQMPTVAPAVALPTGNPGVGQPGGTPGAIVPPGTITPVPRSGLPSRVPTR